MNNELRILGQARAVDGSASIPSYTFSGDIDTGLYRATTNTISITTGGSERWRADSSGQLVGRSSGSTITWTTGLGAINHILGPTDQDLSIRSGTARNVNLVAPSGASVAMYYAGGTLGAYMDPAGAFHVLGTNTVNAANQIVLDMTGSLSRLFFYGTNASTNGSVEFETVRSDGSNVFRFLQVSTGGQVDLAGGSGANFNITSGAGASIQFRNSTPTTVAYFDTSASNAFVARFSVQTSDGTVSSPGYSFENDTDTGAYRPGTNTYALATAGTSAVTIDSSQQVLVGNPSVSGGISGRLHVVDNGSVGATVRTTMANNNPGTFSAWVPQRARGTLTSPTAVADGDGVGGFIGQVYDGGGDIYNNSWNCASVILYAATGQSGSASPGRIVFATTPTASHTMVDQWQITSAGVLSGVTSSSILLTADGSTSSPGMSFFNDADTGAWRPTTNTYALSTAGTEAMRIDASQRTGFGGSPDTSYRLTAAGASLGGLYLTSDAAASLSTLRADAAAGSTTGAQTWVVRRSRGTVASPTATVNGDELFWLDVQATDSNGAFTDTACIRFFADAAPTAGVVPSRVSFWTTPSGGAPVEALRINSSQQTLTTDGSASTPAHSFINDTDTGIYRSTANTLAFATAGTGWTTLDGSGTLLHTKTTGTQDAMQITASGGTGNGAALLIQQTGGSPFGLRIQNQTGQNPMYVQQYSTSDLPQWQSTRARGTISSPSNVQSGDMLAGFLAYGYASGFELGGRFDFYVDGTPGTGDMPTRLVVSLSPDGSGTPAEVWRITSTGQMRTVDGSASAPGQSFLNDTDTGVYRSAANTLGLATAGTLALSLDGSQNANLTGKVATYAGVATAGWGAPAIYAYNRFTGQTASVGNVTSYTVGAADGTFEISAIVNVTSSTLHSFSVQVLYTDEDSNTPAPAMAVWDANSGTVVTSITNGLGARIYYPINMTIRAKAGTTITVTTAGTFTSVTYNVEATIKQLA